MSYDRWERRNLAVLGADHAILSVLAASGVPHAEFTVTDLESRSFCGILVCGGLSPEDAESVMEERVSKLGFGPGHLMLGSDLGSETVPCNHPTGERGEAVAHVYKCKLFDEERDLKVNVDHADMLAAVPEGGTIIASTEKTFVAGFEHLKSKTWGLQFEPTPDVIRKFYGVCQNEMKS